MWTAKRGVFPLPDCCARLRPERDSWEANGSHSKEVGEDDSHEGEDQFLSLEASTETLVHVSDEDTDSDLYLTDGKQIPTSQGPETSR